MLVRRLPAFCSVTAVVLAGLVTPSTASAAPANQPGSYADARFTSSTTLELQGTLLAAEVENLGRTPSGAMAYAVRTDDGTVVPITFTKELPANGQLSGEVVVRGDLARSLDKEGLLPSAGRTIDGDSTAGQTAVETALEIGTPLPVAQATVIVPGETSQTVTPSAHRAYVVKMVDQGSVKGTNAEIGAKVDDMLAYWTTESDGAITSFARQGAIMDYDSAADIPPAQGCGLQSPFTIWNDALHLYPGVNFNDPGNHLIVLVGDECGHSGPVGVATVGTGLSSGGPSILTYDPQTFAATGAHELGHNFGLQHANLDSCPAPDVCEYFDLYSPMALSIAAPAAFGPTALGTLYRSELGLTTPAEVTPVASAQAALTQTFTLAPRSSSSGLRGLLVTDPSTGTTYSVDWRSHTSRDASSFYGNTLGYVFGAPVPLFPTGVVIERQAGLDATYLMTRTVAGRQTGSFDAGSTFSPSSRLSIAVDSIGATASVTVTIAGAPDVSSVTPTIAGIVAVDQQVSAEPGIWTSGASFAYDWLLDGVSTGVSTKSFDVPVSAAGKALSVAVTGSKSGFSPVTKTSATSVVAKGTLASAVPTLDAAPVVDRTVTVLTGSWTAGTSFAYDWRVDGVSTGVSTPSLEVPASAAGKSLTVEVTGTKVGYAATPKTSTPVAVANGTLLAGSAKIAGLLKVGAKVTASEGTWTAGSTFTYAWFVGATKIGTGRTLVVPPAAVGKKLRLAVVASKPGYNTRTAETTSGAVAAGTFASATPKISGTAKVGKTLKVLVGSWSPKPAMTYQWCANGKAISGAKKSSYKIAKKYRGKAITVKVTGKATGYTTLVKASAKTKKVVM